MANKKKVLPKKLKSGMDRGWQLRKNYEFNGVKYEFGKIVQKPLEPTKDDIVEVTENKSFYSAIIEEENNRITNDNTDDIDINNVVKKKEYPQYHLELIEYFKGRDPENFSMNQEQKQLIFNGYKSVYNKVFDITCKYQCIYAYIELFKYVDNLYNLKK